MLGFSDLQADIAAELIRRGYPVMVFNQRSVAEILQMIRMLGGLVGRDRARGGARRRGSSATSTPFAPRPRRLPRRPRVFFEEWDDPLISGIRWVEELVEIAGGEPIFPELRDAKLGKDRIVTPTKSCAANPDVIVASWCGKAVRTERIAARPGGTACPPCATATSTRSSPPTSCSPARRRSPTGSVSCTTSVTRVATPVTGG